VSVLDAHTHLTLGEHPGTCTNVLAHDSGPCQYFPLALVVAHTEAKQMCFCLEGEIASAKFTSAAQCVCTRLQPSIQFLISCSQGIRMQ